MSSPVTIGDLKREGKLLEIGCMACSRHVYVNPAGIRLPSGSAGARSRGAARLLSLLSE